MKTSENGINLLKQFEGCVKNGELHIIYDDKTGRYLDTKQPLPKGATVGYGHLIKPGEDYTNGISEYEATELLKQDIAVSERAVENSILVPLSQNQYDALVIFAYNIGAKNFADSTVVKYVNNPEYHNFKYETLESAWMAWNKSHGVVNKGLVNRRKAEWNLFTNSGIWEN